MGLDNGIDAQNLEAKDIPEYVDVHVPVYRSNREDPWKWEVCYWRKCWGIRSMILGNLFVSTDAESYEYELEAKELENIARDLAPFLDREYYEANAQSIWDYDEMRDHIIQDIINLRWLAWYMKQHPDVKVRFYDSY